MLFEHKGYIVQQGHSYVIIYKTGKALYHATLLAPLTRKQLVGLVEWKDMEWRKSDAKHQRKTDQAD